MSDEREHEMRVERERQDMLDMRERGPRRFPVRGPDPDDLIECAGCIELRDAILANQPAPHPPCQYCGKDNCNE